MSSRTLAALAVGLFMFTTTAWPQGTIRLGGTITSVDAGAQSVFTVGRPFEITFTYVTGLTNQNNSATIGYYNDAITAYTFDYDGGSYVGTATGRMFVYDNFGGADLSQFDVASTISFPNVGGTAISTSGPFYFLSGPTTQWNTNALPSVFPTAWTSGSVTLNWGDPMDFIDPGFSVSGTINSVTVVPEPATWAAWCGAIALLGAALQRRRA